METKSNQYTKGDKPRTVSEFGCGCTVVTNGINDYLIEYCPLHKAAPKMREALQVLTNPFSPLTWEQKMTMADKALTEAEGKSFGSAQDK